MKKSLRERLASRSGETLVETLVSVLVIAMAALLLASMISASGSIDISARNEDDEFYKSLSAAELQKDTDAETGSIEITVQKKNGDEYTDDTTETVQVDAYGGDGLASYKVRGGGGGTP